MQAALSTKQVYTTTSGLQISYAQYGSPTGTPVFFFHGTPGSRLQFAPNHLKARTLNLNIISPDRPGCGHSSFSPSYTLLDHAHHILQLASALNHPRFAICGLSGGAALMYAVAFRAAHRVSVGIDLAGWAPVQQEPSLLHALTPSDRACLRVALRWPWLFMQSFRLVRLACVRPWVVRRVVAPAMGAEGREWMADGERVGLLCEDVGEAFRGGVRGPAYDALVQYRAWGFELRDVRVGIRMFHGTEDRFVPYELALWKKEQLEDCVLETMEGEGHVKFLDMAPELIARAVAQAG